MFEVGKMYIIHEVENGGIGYYGATVIGWEAPLLKVDHPNGGHVVINTGSTHFHKAELSERQPPFQAPEVDFSFNPDRS